MSLRSFFYCVIVSATFAAEFPVDQIEQCKFEDSVCVGRVMGSIFRNHKTGLNSLDLDSIDPLYIKKIDIAQGGNSPVSIILNFTDVQLYGVTAAKIQSVSGYKRDFDGKKIEMKLRIPGSIQLIGDYKIGGQILVLPITGSGSCNITVNRFDLNLKFLPKKMIKNGKEHLQIAKTKVEMLNVRRLYSNFENLFNGDKALGDNMNLFLNENWEIIFGELRSAVETAFAEVIQNLSNKVYANLAWNELFTD